MNQYQIISSEGEDMGVYEGETPEDAMARAAGYASQEAAVAVGIALGIAPFAGRAIPVEARASGYASQEAAVAVGIALGIAPFAGREE